MSVGTIQGGTLLVPAEISSKPVMHQLMIRAPGYQVYNETVLQSPKAGKNLILKGILTHIPETPTGTLYVAVSPPGADIMIDGVPRGVVDQSGISVLRGVKAGNRNILIHLDGYQDYKEWASIEANMDNRVRVTLLPLTTGSLQVTSEPNAASVIVSGVPAGITPVTIPDVPAGQVDVLLTLSGYQGLDRHYYSAARSNSIRPLLPLFRHRLRHLNRKSQLLFRLKNKQRHQLRYLQPLRCPRLLEG